MNQNAITTTGQHRESHRSSEEKQGHSGQRRLPGGRGSGKQPLNKPHGRGRGDRGEIRPARACALVHQDRPHPRPGRRPRRRGLTCERRAPRSAEQRAAGRLRAVPRPRLQPHSGAGRRTPLAAPRTCPPRAALYFRGGALATEDAAAGAATASGVTFSWLTCRPPAPRDGRASYEEEDGASPGGSQPSGPRKEVERGRGARSSLTVGGRAM